jgi:hypothetical protein
MATQYYGAGSFVATAALSANRLVVISPDSGVVACVSGKYPDGVTLEDAAAGDYVPVKFWNSGGTVKVSCSAGPITVGSIVFAGAAGQVTRVAGALITVGRSLTTATAAQTANGLTIIEVMPGWWTANN